MTIGSTIGGLVLYCACAIKRQPACMLFSKPIDSLAAAGSILASVWLEGVGMLVVDCLGEEFLDYVRDGMSVTVKEDGTVCVECAGILCFLSRCLPLPKKHAGRNPNFSDQ